MSTPLHTPAPWFVDKRLLQITANCVGGSQMTNSKFMVCDIRGWGHLQYLDNGKEIQDANAHLIAAAPIMFEALMHIQNTLTDIEDKRLVKLALKMALGGEV